MTAPTVSLLEPTDPPPVAIRNPNGKSPLLLVADHAGRQVPARLGDLGVGTADWARHIAWDIGIAGLCESLSPALDAVCITQAYSRLVIDCNRRPGHPTSIPPVSDGTVIPGNHDLDDGAIAARVRQIFQPYHAAIAAELDRRTRHGQPSVVIAMHSFTPVFGGYVRPWHAGVLHHRDPLLARLLARGLQADGLIVGDNEPYQLSDESDYTIPVHAESRVLRYVELEIRQDLIADPAGQRAWSARLAHRLAEALAALPG